MKILIPSVGSGGFNKPIMCFQDFMPFDRGRGFMYRRWVHENDCLFSPLSATIEVALTDAPAASGATGDVALLNKSATAVGNKGDVDATS